MSKTPYPAEKACGGEIILNTPLRRAIFVSGLIEPAFSSTLMPVC